MQKFLQCYLSNRQQNVISGNVYSSFVEADYGVTQGSVLEPLLFLLYINEIDEYWRQSCLVLYANDTIFKQKRKSTTGDLSQSLNLVSNYLTKNKPNINYEKNMRYEHETKTKKSERKLMIKEKNLMEKSSLKY